MVERLKTWYWKPYAQLGFARWMWRRAWLAVLWSPITPWAVQRVWFRRWMRRSPAIQDILDDYKTQLAEALDAGLWRSLLVDDEDSGADDPPSCEMPW